MFFREDIKSWPVEDKDALDEILRWRIMPHAVLAVKELEHWAALECAMTFATESHTVMHSLCVDRCAAPDALPRGRRVTVR
jgi:hypothetical protein